MPRHLSPRIALAACLLLLAGSEARPDAPRSVQLTILHTNDTHGHLLPFSYPETFDPGSDLSRLDARTDIGGIARRTTLFKRIRAEKGHGTLVLDAGDICDGTPFSTEYQGAADVAAMNTAGYDAACPGNHEFTRTFGQVRKLIAAAKYPLLSTNTEPVDRAIKLFGPYLVKRVGGVRVAIFGLLTTETRSYAGAKGSVEIEDPIAAARRILPVLRKQADFVVALTHVGIEEDRDLARAVSGIDVIVGGHSHTLLTRPEFIAVSGTSPNRGVRGTVIVQDFQWGGTVGRLDLSLSRSSTGGWAVSKYSGQLLPVTSALPEDPATAAAVSTYWKPIAARFGEVIGAAAGDFAQKGNDAAEYNLMADAIRSETGADIELENPGGVRAALVKGPITRAAIAEVDPFPNTVVTFKVTGAELRRILVGARPAVSGIVYEVSGGLLVRAEVGGRPLDDARVYTGATNSFMAERSLKGARDVKDTGRSRRETLVAYIRKRGTVQPAYDGRRIVRDE